MTSFPQTQKPQSPCCGRMVVNQRIDCNRIIDAINDDELAESIADKCYNDVGQDNGEAIEAYRNMLIRIINGEGYGG